ncbi:MAG: sulfur carrier protein ThiS [Rhodocyclaceae bacterium]|jgi:sulfur carrier protein|nr:sulfur carrier protein ThiS [Rhodocyclaceae bacterium]MCO5096356.1 sulfur carrier protein ThiS [Rhodocyclaceae bacterium]MCZ7653176.1 sulfur carrier protein ThiS [Rhodocyclaceae bacterium]
MEISVNGEKRSVADALSVAELLRGMGLEGKRLAVECNGEIVPKSGHAEAQLAEGDRIEIVIAVGGG